MEGATNQIEKELREAYIFLREKNMTIPSETLQFMLDASLEKLEKANLVSNMEKDSLDWYIKEYKPHENFMSQAMSEKGRKDILKMYKIHLQNTKGIIFFPGGMYRTKEVSPKDLKF